MRIIHEDYPYISDNESKKLVKDLMKQKNYSNYYLQQDIHDQWRKDKYGVFSLSGVNNNLLMWAHYANSHKGFCIGFNIENLLDSIFTLSKKAFNHKKVKYYSEYPELNFEVKNHFNNKNLEESIQHLYIKSDIWAYEEEWRLLSLDRNNFTVKFDPISIEYIYFGLKMSDSDKIMIINEIEKLNIKPKLYQAYQKPKKYELEFKEYHSKSL